MKNCYVATLHDGIRVDDVFLVAQKVMRQARNGSNYIRMELKDRTGSIDAFKWDASEAGYADLPLDDFIHVKGTVGRHDGKLQLTIDTFRKCNYTVDPADFLPKCDQDIDVMLSEMKEIIASITNTRLSALLDQFFGDSDMLSKYSTAPAAMRVHHAYIGGLLEHSLSVTKLCVKAAEHYPEIDRDLLLTAAILHDIGKIEEFSWDRAIRYSASGHLLGHIVVGSEMVGRAADAVGGFHDLEKWLLMHMILAHHGEHEYGSPKRPKSIEGIILHTMDDLDAKMNTIKLAIGTAPVETEADIWTDKHWLLGRPLFRGIPRSITGQPIEEAGLEYDPDHGYDPFADN